MGRTGGRPEHTGAPQNFYDAEEARKYSSNRHIIETQTALAERCLELLNLPPVETFGEEGALLLDIGCGSGISGEVLTEAGHRWVGIDVSEAMLQVAREREVEGELVQGDIGEGLPFEAGRFDGAISVSAIQWLCNAEVREHNPVQRMYKFFSTLYACLKRGTRAALQFYPENDRQAEILTKQAMRAGFTGGVLIDYPESTRAKKIYLVLFTGGQVQQMPQALGTTEARDTIESAPRVRLQQSGNRSKKPIKKSKEWILAKKESARRRGFDVRHDSKYTARKRRKI